MRAPALERELSSNGLTLGHYPQSYEYVSLGGCAATRSAGQASTGYGAIEKMVLGLRLAAPAAEIDAAGAARDRGRPGRAPAAGRLGGHAGRDQRGLAARAPGARASTRTRASSSKASRTAGRRFRKLAREHALPDVARLSDEAETRMSLALAGEGGLKGKLGRRYLDARGYGGGCLAIVGFDGGASEVAARRRRTLHLLRRAGGLAVGSSPGRAWREGRFAAPVPARRPARAGRDGRDARDRDAVVEPGRLHADVCARDRARACRAGHARARDVPRLPRLRERRLALLHLPRPPARGRGARAVGGRQAGGFGARSPRAAARSPTITRSAATTRPGWSARSAPGVSMRWRRSRSGSTRPGS